jgi:hypothetical protein
MTRTGTAAGWHRTSQSQVYRASEREVREAVERDLRALGIEVDEFVRRGSEGSLDDERARSLWHMYGDVFRPEWPHSS